MSKTQPTIHHRVKHHVRTRIVKHHQAKQTKIEESMLYPRFLPHVRTKHQEIFAGIALGIVLLAFFVSIVLIGVPSLRGLLDARNDDTSVTATAPKPITASQRNLRVTLQSWKYSKGGDSFKAYPGFNFVVVKVSIIHTRADPTWLAPALQSFVSDGTGQQYQLTPDDSIDDPLPSKEYASGEVASGELAYETPVQAKSLKWCFDLNRNSSRSNPLCIALH